MTKPLDAAVRAAQESYDDHGCYDEIAIAALVAALPEEPPEWFRLIYARYTGYRDHEDMWCALRAHVLGEATN